MIFFPQGFDMPPKDAAALLFLFHPQGFEV